MFYHVGEFTFFSPEGISTFAVVQVLSCLITFLSGCLLIFLAVFTSPEFLEVYRVGLLNLTIESTLFAFFMMLQNPIVHIFDNVYCIEILGVLQSPYVVTSLTVWLFMSNALNICVKCLFRYIQIAHDHLSPLLISKTFIAIITLVHTIILAMGFVFMNLIEVPLDDQSLPTHFERPLSDIRDRNNSILCFSFSTTPQKTVGVLFATWFLLCTVAIFVFATLTILKLRSQRLIVTERTYEMQRMMAIVVFMTAAIPFLLGTVPLFVMVAAFEFFPHFLSLWMNVQPFQQNTICFLLNMVSICGVRPYRNTIISWGKQLKNMLMGKKIGDSSSMRHQSNSN